jgi:hypothetical protein
MLRLKVEYFLITLFVLATAVTSAPKSWPYMKTFDIWGNEENNNELSHKMTRLDNSHNYLNDSATRLEIYSNNFKNLAKKNRRKAKGNIYIFNVVDNTMIERERERERE